VIVLVIGSNGQDGSIFCDLLKQQGVKFVGVSRNSIQTGDEIIESKVDLSNFEASQAFFNQVCPSHIVHLAAVHAPSGSMYKAGELMYDEMYKCHVQITKNILEWQINNSGSKSMIALSSQMYSPQRQNPFITLNSKINPSSKYGETKAESWKLIKSYRAKHGIKSYGMILFNHTSSRSKQNFLFPELASQFSNIIRGRETVIKIRDTEGYIDIFSAYELGIGLIRCIETEFFQDIIFSSGNYVKISEVIQNAARILQISCNIKLISTNPANQIIPLYGDISKTYDILGWKPILSPGEILASMVQEVLNVE
jgi:nucleoside-diphosphate-sugar epimerase